MKTEKITLKNETGLHARPASEIVKIASKYQSTISLIANGKTINAKSFNTKGEPSEEYIRARFIYMLIATNKYKPENICVEATLPKGNGAKSIDSDIIIFKDNSWIKKDFGSAEIRQNILVIMEAKRDSKKDSM